MKGKNAKEKLKKYMLIQSEFQGDGQLKKEYVNKCYRYAKLRYSIEDYFMLMQEHQQKFIALAQTDVEKAKVH